MFLSIAPPPEVTASSGTVDADYQDNVTISCLVTSVQNAATVTWSTSANISSLPDAITKPIGNERHNSSLTLIDVGREEIGDYTCTANSSSGIDFDIITVNVIGMCSYVCWWYW